jgi:hypothetical protein
VDLFSETRLGYIMRKADVTAHGAVAINKIKKEIKTIGRGKKVGIPPTRNHELAEVRPYL